MLGFSILDNVRHRLQAIVQEEDKDLDISQHGEVYDLE